MGNYFLAIFKENIYLLLFLNFDFIKYMYIFVNRGNEKKNKKIGKIEKKLRNYVENVPQNSTFCTF